MKKIFRRFLAISILLCACTGAEADEGKRNTSFSMEHSDVHSTRKMLMLPLSCEAPQWLDASIRGALDAVWRELQGSRLSHRAAVEALALVGSRLFPGFHVSISEREQVILKPERTWTWKTTLLCSEVDERLPQPCADWLKQDIENALEDLKPLVMGVPPEALRWSADSFQTRLNSLISSNIPGWRCSAHVQASDGKAELEVKIYPQTPLLLAVAPETLSTSIPQLLVDRINKKTLEYLSPLTGLPLDWISFHMREITEWLGERQSDNDLLKMIRAGINNEITLRPVTKVTTRVESTTLSLRGWLSVHAGSDANLEAGVHLGHYFVLRDKAAAEVYSELIMKLEHWHADGRFGLRISPLELLWLGLEGTTEDDAHLWYRFWIDGPDKKSYGWLRYSEEDDLEMALGYHLTRYFSLELYYDDRRDDRVSVRALSNF